ALIPKEVGLRWIKDAIERNRTIELFSDILKFSKYDEKEKIWNYEDTLFFRHRTKCHVRPGLHGMKNEVENIFEIIRDYK
ncbi:hypothetical protein, partial [Caldisericum sp.]|uniref:hypothetical protein n=1 Tax=Caldisericum sp. TaxID=2499687 RepID=UPI003D1064D0